jgi:dTDP-4-amino-4,6-dideoxygalactose transaminase
MEPFHDVKAQYSAHRESIERAVRRVLESGRYILGREVADFEAAFSTYLGAAHAVGLASGTASLELALRALDVGAGDEVVIPALTALPTAMAVLSVGATPLLADVDPDTCTLEPESVARELSPATRAIVPVHLYGQCAEMTAILETAVAQGLAVIEDAAQAHGATHRDGKAGTLARIGCFSFYPTKNLGTYGDAGAVVCDEESLVRRVRALRSYGYGNGDASGFSEPGSNARMDELHAAILSAKLVHLDEWNELRRGHARRYREGLAESSVRLPVERAENRHVYHQFVVRCPRRDELRAHLERSGIATAIHYPQAVHEVPALQGRVRFRNRPRCAEEMARQVLSLPIYPELPPAQLERVIDSIRAFR